MKTEGRWSIKRCSACGGIFPRGKEFFALKGGGKLACRCRECEKKRLREKYRKYQYRNKKVRKAEGDQNKVVSSWKETGLKQCSVCKQVLMVDFFFTKSDGTPMTPCKKCKHKKNMEYRKKAKELGKKSYFARLEENRKWSKTNRDKRRKQLNEWRKNNPERNRAIQASRRARERKATGRFTAEDIEKLMLFQKGKCLYCRCDIRKRFHIDHIVPIKHGGLNDKTNIQLLCPSCNSSKGAKLPEEFSKHRFLQSTKQGTIPLF